MPKNHLYRHTLNLFLWPKAGAAIASHTCQVSVYIPGVIIYLHEKYIEGHRLRTKPFLFQYLRILGYFYDTKK
jgi:hypothetical protein